MADLIGLHVHVTRSGPMFNGGVRRAVNDYVDDWEEDVADYALNHIRRTFHSSFKAPTGRYESRVRIANDGGHPNITDGGNRGPVYGPWLEGVGSRNRSTRFKGYHAFRKAAARVERMAGLIGERLLDRRYLRRMN
jgi:hypothetical protein